MHAPYDINDYMDEVFASAKAYIDGLGYTDVPFSSVYADIIDGCDVTGSECDGYLNTDDAIAAVSRLVWDKRFKEAFYPEMGYDIMEYATFPELFDTEVRRYCVSRLRERITDYYAAKGFESIAEEE